MTLLFVSVLSGEKMPQWLISVLLCGYCELANKSTSDFRSFCCRAGMPPSPRPPPPHPDALHNKWMAALIKSLCAFGASLVGRAQSRTQAPKGGKFSHLQPQWRPDEEQGFGFLKCCFSLRHWGFTALTCFVSPSTLRELWSSPFKYFYCNAMCVNVKCMWSELLCWTKEK